MTTYKKDQGRLARMAAFWAVALMLLFACVSMHVWLSGTFHEALGQPINEIVIPIVGIELTPSFLITTALFAVGLFFLNRWESRPQVSELLVETESELRKVTWPGGEEVVDSSLVVIACVVFLMAYLAMSDIALGWFFGRILNPGG
jgi:preprotein translocase SecE subunit